MTTETTETAQAGPNFTLQEKVEVLIGAGIYVYQWHEADDTYFPLPHIQFDGGEDEGLQAAKMFIDRGVPVVMIHREWLHGSKGFNKPTWILYFHRHPEQMRPGYCQ